MIAIFLRLEIIFVIAHKWEYTKQNKPQRIKMFQHNMWGQKNKEIKLNDQIATKKKIKDKKKDINRDVNRNIWESACSKF